MEGSYLLDLFKTLSREERADFERFAIMQVPGSECALDKRLSLIRIMLRAAPDFDAASLHKRVVFRQLFNAETYTQGRLDKVMAEVNRWLKAYLLYSHQQENAASPTQQIAWSEILKTRQLKTWHQHHLNKMLKNKPFPANRDDYLDAFRLELKLCEHESAHNYLKGDLNVPQALEALDLYYFTARLELINNLLLQRKVTKISLEASSPGLAVIQLPEVYRNQSPILKIAFEIYQILQQDRPPLEDFQRLSALIYQHEKTIAPAMLQQFYAYLRNICTILINSGHNELLPVYHQIQKDDLARGYLYHGNGLLPASVYLSVTNGAIRANQPQWALEFVEAHRERIMGENAQRDLYRLNKALCLFAFRHYEAALDLIAPTFEFLNYTLLSKRLEIKILYELDSELLPYKAGAFKVFITRASQKFLPPELKTPNADFVNLLLQIIRSKPRDKDRKTLLLNRINAKPQAAERDWILEKVKNLK